MELHQAPNIPSTCNQSTCLKLAKLRKFNCMCIIWSLGAILLTVLLIFNFLPLLTEYSFNNVDTRITVVRNGNPRPQNLTICLPYYSRSLAAVANWISENAKFSMEFLNSSFNDSLECEALKNHSWDIWDEINPEILQEQPSQVLEYTLASAFLTKVLDGDDFDVLIINRTNFNWNQPIIDSIQRLLECIRNKDNRYLANSVEYVPPNACNSFDSDTIPRLTKQKIKLLREYFVQAIEVYLKIDIFYQLNESVMDGYLRNRNVIVITLDGICFPLLNNSVQEVFKYETNEVQSIDPPWIRYKRHVPLTIWPDQSTLYGVTYFLDTVYATDLSNMENINSEKVKLAFDINMQIVETRDQMVCTKDNTPPLVCTVQRQLHEVISHCGCIPFSLQNLYQTDLPLCNDILYAKCSDRLLWTVRKHEEECNNKCEDTFYKWKSIGIAVHQDSPNMTFTIVIPPHHIAPYVRLSVTVKNTPEQFLSQIGGLVNFYLGFSGLSCVGFVIYCIGVIREKWQGDSQEGRDAEQRL